MISSRVELHRFPLKEPFVISGQVFHDTNTIRVTLEAGGHTGRGEAVGVNYIGETPDGLASGAAAALAEIGNALSFDTLHEALPRGGVRAAIDCALWDLRCKQEGRRIWEILGIRPRAITTAFTLGIDTPDRLAAKALAARATGMLKLKLDADDPIAKVSAVRAARPDAQIIVDVNQGWTFDMLRQHAPVLAGLGVELIEQPLPRGADDALAGYASPVPLAADESCLDTSELAGAGAYDFINIKLDKTGGLTEALRLALQAQRAGKQLMVGNMAGTSLSMAPGWIIAQPCRYIDLDGPLLIQQDIEHAIAYTAGGEMSVPDRELWG